MSAVPEGTDTKADAGADTGKEGHTLASRIRARFAPLGGAELTQEPREPLRPAPDFEPVG